jgi:toxin ParE1/3/4
LSYRLARAAESDLAQIAEYTVGAFGVAQANAYRQLMLTALNNIATEPMRLSSQSHDHISNGLRSYRVALAGKRISAASHMLWYRIETSPQMVVVLRILHERMDPGRHLN